MPCFHRTLAPIIASLAFSDDVGYNDDAVLLQRRSLVPKFVFVHIAKTAGTSFQVDGGSLVQPAMEFFHNGEACFDVTETLLPNATYAVLFRSPVPHILSQFLHCKEFVLPAAGFCKSFAEGDVYEGFDRWVAYFEKLRGKPHPTDFEGLRKEAFNCYNPWNMQTRYFAQQTDQEIGTHEWHCHVTLNSYEPSAERAKRILTERVHFLGISDMYTETLCLLHFLMHNDVPHTCSCGGPGPLKEMSHDDHGLPEHGVDELPRHLHEQLSEFVQEDIRLYAFALDRFEAELRRASKSTGVQMVCEDRFKELRAEIVRVQSFQSN
ncbi:unnamed protein product [Effrenium voratum]|uniref:Uncharacterized protein n=1 Tax=Effrenium voratum TaxID=2562239 RepID=A0AA36NAL4_9DINO|nr:unnamed protein product [Effrenium voratum]CAJ1429652.1 unnamed protein product [Effrenium voratum]